MNAVCEMPRWVIVLASIYVGVCTAFAAEQAFRGEAVTTWTSITWPEKSAPQDGWFDPRYTTQFDESYAYVRDRWIIGDHDYQIRDLMGRKI